MNRREKLMSPLITPAVNFDNRVVMAPMSRRRSPNRIPAPYAALYYGQRASAGLIITENTAVTANGVGYLDAPGIYNDKQKQVWKEIAEKVHNRGGKIFM